MSSKERVLTAFARREPDRVPVDYSANPGIDRRLKAHFGLAEDDGEGLRQALGVDFRGVGAPYIGPKLHADVPERSVDMWGIHRRLVEHESGNYWDYCDFPLQSATLDEVDAWAMPSPDDFDYSAIPGQCERYKDYCIGVGGDGCVMNTAGFFRGMDQVFLDLATDDEAGLRLIDRFLGVQLEILHRSLEAGKGLIDTVWMGEDLGTQRGPIISVKTFRKHILPRHKPFVDTAKAYGLPVVLHTCGSSSWTYDDYIELGVTVVDTLQPEAKDMSPRYLKDRFGDRLAFHGCISTAGAVAFGTVEDTIADVRQTLEIMMPGGGYALSPTHSLQDNSPTENVVAMYEAARTYGRYA
jgi:uroporphyrinogen decarboxylase